jgi:Kdo2-lipid IVA lauroyltransferase/acyltransferase
MAAPVLTGPRTGSRAPAGVAAARDAYVLTVMALMTLVARVGSVRFRDLVVNGIAEAAYRLSSAKRVGTEAMLDRVFGRHLTDHRRRLIVRGAFRECWLDFFSLLPLRGHAGADLARIEGVEHLERALAGGRGVVVWVSNHWGGMSMLKRTLHTRGYPLHKVHAEYHLGGFSGGGATWVQRRIIAPFFDRHEAAIVTGIVTIVPGSLAFTRDLDRRLRANGVVCAAADGRLGRRFVPRPLLGVAEAFPTGVVSLARATGAPLLPTFGISGRIRRVVIEPPVTLPATGDRDDADRTAIAAYVERLERRMRRHPSRFVNWHLVGQELPTGLPTGLPADSG